MAGTFDGAEFTQFMFDANNMWLLYTGYLVFFMQAGFSMLESGFVRAKNTKNILLKNVMDTCIGALMWYLTGFSFAFGVGPTNAALNSINNYSFAQEWDNLIPVITQIQPYPVAPNFSSHVAGAGLGPLGPNVPVYNLPTQDTPFCGAGNWASYNNDFTFGPNYYALWLFQWVFQATSATIVSGAVAERIQLRAYMIFTAFMAGWIYPINMHWAWDGDGWLTGFRPDPIVGNGVIDFAGSGVVHMIGGGSALMGAIFTGPRYGRFNADGTYNEMPGHSSVLIVLGTLILWFGWYGFNPGSTLGIISYSETQSVGPAGEAAFGPQANGGGYVSSKAAVNTTLTAASSGISSLILHVLMGNQPDIAPTCNGIITGLVVITSPCATIEPWAAVTIGIIAAPVWYFAAIYIRKLRIDDPLDASAIHYFGGAWGMLSVGLFSTPWGIMDAGYNYPLMCSIFYCGDLKGIYGARQLAMQLLAMTMYSVWTMSNSALLFATMNLLGFLRVSHEDEIAGMDVSHHGGSAYAYNDKV